MPTLAVWPPTTWRDLRVTHGCASCTAVYIRPPRRFSSRISSKGTTDRRLMAVSPRHGVRTVVPASRRPRGRPGTSMSGWTWSRRQRSDRGDRRGIGRGSHLVIGVKGRFGRRGAWGDRSSNRPPCSLGRSCGRGRPGARSSAPPISPIVPGRRPVASTLPGKMGNLSWPPVVDYSPVVVVPEAFGPGIPIPVSDGTQGHSQGGR